MIFRLKYEIFALLELSNLFALFSGVVILIERLLRAEPMILIERLLSAEPVHSFLIIRFHFNNLSHIFAFFVLGIHALTGFSFWILKLRFFPVPFPLRFPLLLKPSPGLFVNCKQLRLVLLCVTILDNRDGVCAFPQHLQKYL
jgi:hypothetical protein